MLRIDREEAPTMSEHVRNAAQILPRDLLKGRCVFVTGGGSGINLGIARAFASVGANLAICGRTQEKLDRAAAQLREAGATALAIAADVRLPEQLTAAFERTRDELGDIDVLVCGAAGNFLSPAEILSPKGFKTVMDIDLLGSFNAARLAFDQLARSRGSIIFVTAPQAFIAHAYQAHVGPAKAGVEMLMKSLALEWGPYGIRSNSVIPGLVADTEGVRRIIGDGQSEFLDHIPLRRMGAVEDVGHAAVFLASPLASYITGTSLWVDGGQGLPGSGLFNRNGAEFLATASRETP